VNWDELGVIGKGEIVSRVNEWELNRWAKENIGGEGGYDNSWGCCCIG